MSTRTSIPVPHTHLLDEFDYPPTSSMPGSAGSDSASSSSVSRSHSGSGSKRRLESRTHLNTGSGFHSFEESQAKRANTHSHSHRGPLSDLTNAQPSNQTNEKSRTTRSAAANNSGSLKKTRSAASNSSSHHRTVLTRSAARSSSRAKPAKAAEAESEGDSAANTSISGNLNLSINLNTSFSESSENENDSSAGDSAELQCEESIGGAEELEQRMRELQANSGQKQKQKPMTGSNLVQNAANSTSSHHRSGDAKGECFFWNTVAESELEMEFESIRRKDEKEKEKEKDNENRNNTTASSGGKKASVSAVTSTAAGSGTESQRGSKIRVQANYIELGSNEDEEDQDSMNDGIFASLNSSTSSDVGAQTASQPQPQLLAVHQRRLSGERAKPMTASSSNNTSRSALSASVSQSQSGSLPPAPLAHSHFLRLADPSVPHHRDTRIFLTTPTAPVPNYDEVLESLLRIEMKYAPRRDYMETVQHDLSYSMRSILIDWLVEVAEEYQLSTQTLFLTVSYVDRFLSFIPMERSKLQLLGVTAMLLASKYWEIRPPLVDDFVYISDNTYSRSQVITMESWILKTLKFSLSGVTPWDFTRPFMELANVDNATEPLVDLLLELFLLHATYLEHRPSHIAAAGVFLARWTRGLKPEWPAALAAHVPFKLSDILPLAITMSDNHSRLTNPDLASEIAATHGGCPLKAIREKYSEDCFQNVAYITPRPLDDFLTMYGY